MLRLQEEGTAIISDTTVRGAYCLRAAINNHRTRYDDLRLLIKETIRLGETDWYRPNTRAAETKTLLLEGLSICVQLN